MKFLIWTVLFFLPLGLFSQCIDIEVADFSFEEGTFAEANPGFETGYWYRNDGAELFDNVSYHGDFSLCSNAGGAQQYIQVDTNTTYYLSCYVQNASNDPWVSFIINQVFQPIFMVESDDWTYISQSFNSGSDTIANIGFYSSAACFDNFQLTCNPVVSTKEIDRENFPFKIYPIPSSGTFTLETTNHCSIKLYDISGNLVEEQFNVNGTIDFGIELAPSIYFIHVFSKDKKWIQKIIKI